MSMKKILGCIRKADEEFNMIQDGDTVCVGVSGGKDSMLLLYSMALYKKFATVDFNVVGIHIEMGFPNMDFSKADEFCQKNDITLYHEPSQIYEILKLNKTDDGRLRCSLCSKFKKATVIDAAKKYGCNKVAFAHHGDDAVETLFMNMIYGGKIATFLPKMYLDRTDMNFIRPLILASETDIVSACTQANIPIVPSTCPADKNTKREEFKNLLNDLYEKYPQSKSNLLLSLSNEQQIMLWHKEPRNKK
ncbi:tRNA 2-thiocytidine biosynthesis TtcA family protein [Tannockella kyphosi]|uniref:tRNA 2-thiocytidine biosynthesis TtcA family protein n=1 Tax=Tannockella kyphosi TaxID=2899121 RepID=UPI002012FEB6|nr:ATP-binding protein [Tannockella kyphosi]